MTTKNTMRTGFTKTGFSRSGFGACGHFKLCNMGKRACHYESIDPEVLELCAAFIRNQNKDSVSDSCSEKEQADVEKTGEEIVEEQLSLF